MDTNQHSSNTSLETRYWKLKLVRGQYGLVQISADLVRDQYGLVQISADLVRGQSGLVQISAEIVLALDFLILRK